MVAIGKMIGETVLKAAIMFLVMEGLRKLTRPTPAKVVLTPQEGKVE